ncbi:MAG: hypothetical protein ACRD88_04405, partial [Terriglobia bacterium]
LPETNKERRQSNAGGRRVDYRGHQLRNRSGWTGAKKNPAGISNSGGGWTGRMSRIRIVASALGPA